MSLRRYAARKDDNHKAIVSAFEAHGCIVHNWGTDGAPDLVCGIRGITFLVEVKDGSKVPSARKLTDAQAVWHRRWKGSPVWVVEDVSQVPVVLSAVASEGGGQIR